MTKRRIVFFIALVSITIIMIIYIQKIKQPTYADILIALIFPVLITIITYAIQPVSEWLDNYLNEPNLKNKGCTIYLYGGAGTGKTSLANSWYTANTRPHVSTTDIHCYELEIPRNSLKRKYTKIRVIDYKGQKQSQVTTNIPDKFVGRKNKRLVNAALFLVDIVGRFDENDDILDTERKQLLWLNSNTEVKVNERIKEHTYYINGSLEIVFSVIYSLNLRSVKLVINKFDIIENLLKNGFLPNPSNLDHTDYAKNLFEKIESEISQACRENNIQDFSVEVISAKKDYRTRFVLESIISTYENYIQQI